MKTLILSTAMFLCANHAATAAQWDWNLTSPLGQVSANPHIYLSTPDNIQLPITAYATHITDLPVGTTWTAPTATTSHVHLYAKTEGGTETGLGISTDRSHDDQEIYVNSFLQIDLQFVMLKTVIDKLTLTVGSIQNGESFDLWGSNIAGQPGKLLLTGGASYDDVPFAVPSYGNYRYLSIGAGTGDVLLDGISASAPEPGTFGLAAIMILGVLALRRYCTE
jgi:hypothetical protein